jgi:serine protease AprX
MRYANSLDDIIRHVNANKAWTISRGAGVSIAIIDTGISAEALEFEGWKRSHHSWPSPQKAWADISGHGSMVACVAAATKECGGKFNGVAPDSEIISCSTCFEEEELCEIYNYLISLVTRESINRLVINNSYSIRSGTRPEVRAEDPFPNIVREATHLGIVSVFPAGNNHVIRGGNDPLKCEPCSIWGANSLDEVICVGTVGQDNCMHKPPRLRHGYCHRDSSRGPGQFARETVKPDCVTPTYGEVLWGNRYVMNEWWGTSGAAAQVSGLAALILSANPLLTPEQVAGIIKRTCVPLPLPAF